jgi:predicted transcriptional regulator
MFNLHNIYNAGSNFIVEMGQNSDYIKRDKLDILLGILDIASAPVKKTHILYRANINYYQLTRYLDLLLGLGMLEQINEPYKGYRITEKGRQMLQLFKQGEFVSMMGSEAARKAVPEIEAVSAV